MDEVVEVKDTIHNIRSRPDWVYYPVQDILRSYWEQDIKEGFGMVNSIQSKNPKILELKKYSEGIDEKLQFLRKPVGMGHQEAELLMSKIPQKDHDAGFDATILRLQRETKYLEELEDVGISSALLTGLENGKYGAWVKFISPDSFYAKGMQKKGSAGRYIPMLDMVVIPQKAPTSEEMWLMLATEGTLPSVVSHLDHELTHDLQWNKIQRSAILGLNSAQTVSYFWLIKTYGILTSLGISNVVGIASKRIAKNLSNDGMLQEIHSFSASADSPTAKEDEFDEREEISGHVINAYNLKDRELFDALYAYDLIHNLKMLGTNDRELGKLVNMAKFDKKSRRFYKLEKALEKKSMEWGVNNPEDVGNLLTALNAKHDLELRYQRHKAEEVAARELRRETGNWFT